LANIYPDHNQDTPHLDGFGSNLLKCYPCRLGEYTGKKILRGEIPRSIDSVQ